MRVSQTTFALRWAAFALAVVAMAAFGPSGFAAKEFIRPGKLVAKRPASGDPPDGQTGIDTPSDR